MTYLALNILFSSAFGLCIKWIGVRKREDIFTVGPINYLTAALLVTPLFVGQDATTDFSAVLCGGWMGAIYFTAFFFVVYSIKHVGAAPTTVVGGLSLLLPIGVAAVLWKETPTLAQCVGVGFAVVALALIGVRRKPRVEPEHSTHAAEPPGESIGSRKRYIIALVLTAFFLLAGSARLAQRTLKHVVENADEQRATFLFTAFVVASVPSIILLIARRRKISLAEFGMGVAMGASNVLQSHFILTALEQFEGYIVFPVSAAGGLLLTTFVATRLLGEKLNRQTYVGIAVAVVALVLLNWVGGE